MTRFLLTLIVSILALFSQPALAQGVQAPRCWPGFGGVDFVSGMHGTYNSGHRYAAWRCLNADGFDWNRVTLVARADFTPQMVDKLDTETQTQYATRLWNLNVSLPCSDSAIKSICDSAAAEMSKSSREPPAYVVARNGTSTTRPAYSLVNGVIGTTALVGVRAPVGASCACWASGVRKVPGDVKSTAYCMWVRPVVAENRADQVTVCTPA